MAKVVFFVPYSELLEPARRLGEKYSSFSSVRVEYVHTEEIARRAQELERDGVDLIIARGAQAELVKRSVRLPVVAFKASTQAVGRTILALKRELGAQTPKLGLIALSNTLVDTAYYNELFDVSLALYIAEEPAELCALVDRAQSDGCMAVIGGNTVLGRARQIDLPGAFLRSGEESIRDAYDTADRVAYAIDLEKKRTAEIDTMLNHTAGGVMQVDLQGRICRVNHVCLRMLGCGEQRLLGRALPDVIPQIAQQDLEACAYAEEDTHAFVVDIRNRTVVLNAVTIRVEERPVGLILTFQAGDDIRRMDSELRLEMNRRGFTAGCTFEEFVAEDAGTAALVKRAKRMAKHAVPLMLLGEPRDGADLLAECIHNESPFRHNAFIAVDCAAYPDEDLDNMLFGNYTTRKDSPASLAELAKDGTLYLKNIEALCPQTQYKLARLAQGQFLHNGAHLPEPMRVRIIACAPVSLMRRVQERSFRSDLYYALHVLQLEVTPLKNRGADIPGWFARDLTHWQTVYAKPVRLTEGAEKLAAGYDWPGGLDQINCVCQRIVLLCERRSIGEDFLRAQLEQLAPTLLPGTDTVVVYKDRKAVRIAELLRQYHGNREKVAAELGVSKTTLWRYIKKYGIASDFSY